MQSVIVAGLNILRRKLGKREGDLEQIAGSAIESADKAAKLVRRLLTFSRMQPSEHKPIDANAVVAEFSELLRRTELPASHFIGGLSALDRLESVLTNA